jgi:hypothetical protein
LTFPPSSSSFVFLIRATTSSTSSIIHMLSQLITSTQCALLPPTRWCLGQGLRMDCPHRRRTGHDKVPVCSCGHQHRRLRIWCHRCPYI